MEENTVNSNMSDKDKEQAEFNPLLQDTPAAKRARKNLSCWFGAMSGSYWFSSCFTMYLTTFLISRGWGTSEVGLLNSINNAVGAVSTPIWGAFSDKIRSVKKVLIILILASCAAYFLIPFMDWKIAGISMLFILIPISTFFKNPLNSLVDNWTVRSCNKFALNFGAIRSTGSVTFGIVGLALGFLVPKINALTPSGDLGIRLTFSFYSITLLILLFTVLRIREEGNTKGTRKQRFSEMQFGRLFKNYYYMTYLAYAIIIQIPLSCVTSFFSYLLKEIGVNISYIGYVQGCKAFIEIPMLLLMDRIRNKCPLYYLLIASGILYMLEAFFYSISGNFTHIMLICLLQGLAGGLHIAAGSNYVATLAPDNLKATAQTLNSSMVSISGIIGNAVGGFIIEFIGIRMFYRFSSYLLLTALVLYCLTFVLGEKVLKIPRPKIVRHGL